MQESEDSALLEQYVNEGSEAAFATLVQRHVNKVYSVALRHTRNPNQAEEIAQAVFVMLARKARGLGQRVILSGWLYQTARLASVTWLRAEIRRTKREQEAQLQTSINEEPSDVWPEIAPLLDAAMASLNELDRHAVVLRFFDGKSMREVGAALGTGEDAAKMRVNRAVEKMRAFFARRGVAHSAGILTAAIAAHSVQAAPVALANSITLAALAGDVSAAATAATFTKGALTIMARIKLKTGLTAAVLAACVSVPLLVQHQAQAHVREMDVDLAAQKTKLAQLRADQTRLAKLGGMNALTTNQANDLQRLREEIGPLRQLTNDVAQLHVENRDLKSRAGQDKPKNPLQIKEDAVAKMGFQKQAMVAWFMYANEHQGQFPADFDQAGPFLSDAVKTNRDVTADQFEVVYQGSMSSIEKPSETIVLRELDAWPTAPSQEKPAGWCKSYAFADGHCEIHFEPQNNFDAYEQAHMVAPSADGQ